MHIQQKKYIYINTNIIIQFLFLKIEIVIISSK